MTQLSAEKTLRRETSVNYRGRPLVVILHDRYIELHEKGRRDEDSHVTLDYATLYELAMKVRANQRRNGVAV